MKALLNHPIEEIKRILGLAYPIDSKWGRLYMPSTETQEAAVEPLFGFGFATPRNPASTGSLTQIVGRK